MTRIVACLGIALLAGCGFEWFPSNNPSLSNLSTATQSNVSTAKKVVSFSVISAARFSPGDGNSLKVTANPDSAAPAR